MRSGTTAGVPIAVVTLTPEQSDAFDRLGALVVVRRISPQRCCTA